MSFKNFLNNTTTRSNFNNLINLMKRIVLNIEGNIKSKGIEAIRSNQLFFMNIFFDLDM